MFKLFKCRDKKEKLGLALGSTCFLPSFLIAIGIGMFKNFVLGIIVLCISQLLWLGSITLCTQSLEIENRQLKEKIKELGGE